MKRVWLFRFSIPTIAFLSLSFTASAQNCFVPNGTDRNLGLSESYYQPCGSGSSVDQYTMCCATFRQAPDTCMKNGLCANNETGPHLVWRESCTDPTWKSPSCIKLCSDGIGECFPQINVQACQQSIIDENGYEMSSGDQMVTPCADGSCCCGQNATDCCNSNKGVWIVNGTTTNIDPASATYSSATKSSSISSSSSSTTSTATITNAPDTTATPTSPTSTPKDHTGVIAGGVIGGLAVLALAAGAAYYILKQKRRGSTDMPESSAKYSELAPNGDKSPALASGSSGVEAMEMDGMTQRMEMEGERHVGPELQGDLRHHELE